MKLIINGSAVLRSSRGVRRYYDNIIPHLNWPGGISMSAVYNSGAVSRVRELAHRGQYDAVFWSPAQRGPLFAKNHVVTVHDCINVEYTYRNDWRLPALRLATQQLLSNAERVVAISNATRDALVRNYRIRDSALVVIQSSCDVNIAATELAAPPHIATLPPFVLLVTNSLPHKNTVRACQALVQSRARLAGVELRVVGSLPLEALEICHRGGLTVHTPPSVSDAALWDWYRACTFLLAPSLDEGHDLPVAEALALGANVLCSDIPAHREFYDGLVAYFDPMDTDAMTDAIDQALERQGRWFQSNLPTRSFSDVANDYKQLFSGICAKS